MKIINQQVDTLKLHFYKSFDSSENELNHYNNFIDDFIDKKNEAMKLKVRYGDERLINHELLNYRFKVLATTNRGFNVSIKNNDVFISLRKLKKEDNNPFIKIEFRAEYLTRCGYVEAIKRVQLFIDRIIPNYNIKVSEIHLATDLQGFEFNILDTYKFKTTSRNTKLYESTDDKLSYLSSRKFTGFSFGNGDFMLRVYNKTFEIDKFKNKSFIKPLKWDINPNYNPNKEVWRIETQIRRNKLKTILDTNGNLLDGFKVVLDSIPELWAMSIDQFSFRDLSDQDSIDIMKGNTLIKGEYRPLTQDTIKKRFQRAKVKQIWQDIRSFNGYEDKENNLTKHKEVKTGSMLFVGNAVKSLVSTLSKYNQGQFDSEILKNTIEKVNKENLEKHGLTILESGRLKMMDYLFKAREYQKINGVIFDNFDLLEKNILDDIESQFNLIENLMPTSSTVEAYIKQHRKLINQSINEFNND